MAEDWPRPGDQARYSQRLAGLVVSGRSEALLSQQGKILPAFIVSVEPAVAIASDFDRVSRKRLSTKIYTPEKPTQRLRRISAEDASSTARVSKAMVCTSPFQCCQYSGTSSHARCRT